MSPRALSGATASIQPIRLRRTQREVRRAVQMRKASYQNASPSGTQTQEVLMTVLRTLKQCAHSPLEALNHAVVHHGKTGNLPAVPLRITSGG